MNKCSNGKEGTVIGTGCLDWRVYHNLLCRWLFVWRILKIPLHNLETIVPVPQAINKSNNCFLVIALRIDNEGCPVSIIIGSEESWNYLDRLFGKPVTYASKS